MAKYEKAINVSNLKFKVCSSDSSSSSSEEEEGATEDEREKIKLQQFVRKATQRHQELKKAKQIEDGCQNKYPQGVMRENDELRKYKTLNWACTFIADRGCGEELKPDDLLQRRRKKGDMKREKSSWTSSDTDESSGEELEFDEEKLLVLQTKLEKALEGVKVLSKRDRRRVRKAEEYDAFFTEGLSVSDEEAADERDPGTDSSIGVIGIPGGRDVDEVLEENNNKEKCSSVSEAENAMGQSEKAEKVLSGEENIKNGEGSLEQLKSPGVEGVLDGVQLKSPRKGKGKKEKMSKISPLRKMFPQRFSMRWKRNPRFQVPRGKGE